MTVVINFSINTKICTFLKQVFEEQQIHVPLLWASGDVCPGLQTQGGSPQLLVLQPGRNGLLRCLLLEYMSDIFYG